MHVTVRDYTLCIGSTYFNIRCLFCTATSVKQEAHLLFFKYLSSGIVPIYYFYLLSNSNSCELEWARNLKHGPMIGNDVHQRLLKYEPSQPDGGAVTKA